MNRIEFLKSIFAFGAISSCPSILAFDDKPKEIDLLKPYRDRLVNFVNHINYFRNKSLCGWQNEYLRRICFSNLTCIYPEKCDLSSLSLLNSFYAHWRAMAFPNQHIYRIVPDINHAKSCGVLSIFAEGSSVDLMSIHEFCERIEDFTHELPNGYDNVYIIETPPQYPNKAFNLMELINLCNSGAQVVMHSKPYTICQYVIPSVVGIKFKKENSIVKLCNMSVLNTKFRNELIERGFNLESSNMELVTDNCRMNILEDMTWCN